ncbi:MAG: helix-turn-helix transcriptional regulator [Ktedonobacteraceae bacterium]
MGKEPNKKLIRQRELRGWSQEKLAEAIGTTAKIVGRWERG